MSEVKDRLKKLANVESTYPHIFSAYFRVRDGAQSLIRECKIFLKNRVSEIESVLSGDTKAKQGLHREAEVAARILGQDIPQSVTGVAIFIRDGEVFERFDTQFRFTNQVAYRRVPHIAQLAFMDEEMEPFLIVSVDTQSAKVFDVAMGVMGEGPTAKVSNEIESRIRTGGMTTMRYQKRLDQKRKDHLSEVADEVGKIVREFNHKRVMLVGQDKATAELLDLLPADVKRRVIDRRSLDAKSSQLDITNEALKHFAKAEELEEAEKIRLVRIEIHSSAMAVAGVNNVIRAINSGQAHEILMRYDYEERGVECSVCGEVTVGRASTAGKCASCDASKEHLKDLDIREYITRQALKFNVALEYIKLPEFRSTLGNVACLLHSPMIYHGHRSGNSDGRLAQV
jgi:hypothetical protein